MVSGGRKKGCFDCDSTGATTCTHTSGWLAGRSASAQATPVLTKAFSQSDCNLIIS